MSNATQVFSDNEDEEDKKSTVSSSSEDDDDDIEKDVLDCTASLAERTAGNVHPYAEHLREYARRRKVVSDFVRREVDDVDAEEPPFAELLARNSAERAAYLEAWQDTARFVARHVLAPRLPPGVSNVNMVDDFRRSVLTLTWTQVAEALADWEVTREALFPRRLDWLGAPPFSCARLGIPDARIADHVPDAPVRTVSNVAVREWVRALRAGGNDGEAPTLRGASLDDHRPSRRSDVRTLAEARAAVAKRRWRRES